MKEVVLKPKWSCFEIKNSPRIANFFDVQQIDYNEMSFSLNELREFYRFNRVNGSILIDELSLRGFDFCTERPTSFFPNKFNYKRIIRVNHSRRNCYQKINFSLLGLSNFIAKYNIVDDSFFDYIPLEGFLRINSNISIQMLENEMLTAGFDIVNISEKNIEVFNLIKESEFPKLISTIKKNSINDINDFCENIDTLIRKTQNLNKYDVQKLKLMVNWFDKSGNIKDFRNIEIYDYFKVHDNVLLSYCKKNNISKVIQLIKDIEINNFSKYTITYINTFFDYLKFYYFININESLKNISITDIPNIGTEKTINILLKYNIKTVSDVLIADLSNLAGIGKGKIKNIYISVLDYIENPIQTNKSDEKNIPTILHNLKIEDFIIYSGIGVGVFLNYCNKNNYIYIRDLTKLNLEKELKSVNMLGKVKSKEIITLFTNSKYDVSSLKELIKVLVEDFKSKNSELYSIIYERIIKNKTLEEIGIENHITRERVRQIEATANKMLGKFANILLDYLIHDEKCKVIEETTLNNLLDDEDYSKIIFNIIKQDDKILFVENFEKLFVKMNCTNIEQLFVEIKNFFDGIDNKDILSYTETQSFILEKINEYEIGKEIELKEFDKIIEAGKYKAVGNILLKKGLHANDIYLSIFKEYYPNGVRFDEKNCDDIKEKYFKVTGEKTDISNRNLSAKIQREKDVIICGSNSYIHIDNVKITKKLIDSIKEYIIHLFKLEDISSVYTDKIYSEFKEELNYYGVDNYIYLYGILRYYFMEDFSFNNYWITKSGKNDVTRELALLEYLKKDINYNIGVPKEKIISLFGLTGPYLINIITCSNEIKECYNKENIIYEGNYKLSDNLLNKINNYIDACIDKQLGFISIKHILSKFDIYFEEEGIIDEFTLSDVLSIYFEKYYIKDLYVCKNKVEHQLDEYFFFDLFVDSKKEITRKDFVEFAKEKSIYENRIYDVLKNRFCDLYQINITDFISNITISSEQIQKIYSVIENNLVNVDFMLLSDLKKNGELYKMPNLGYSWNEYLLRSILKKNMKENYVLIDIPGAMLFTERGILVKKELQIDNYIDFMKYVYMSNCYYELDNVNQLFRVLQAKGLINDTLPAEFKKIVVDEYGRLIRC